ncbi:AraC family transcriptional regulator [Mycolicibacterium mengxianglii]|uniref:AraC family transcriptional regulator n=1 Tax=Mycolicibacterium mengxianglii TaxID=2736649 RepID=UPI0018EF037D|nr:helix-turn-helix domain-containing protein [Mycolicibacterium mengxianglii]
MEACKNAPQPAPQLGVVGRAGSTESFQLSRWAPSAKAGEFVEHFWSVHWDLADGDTHDSTVITFPVVHLTHEWGTDGSRHGYPMPATLVHGVVDTVFRTTLQRSGSVVGARFHPGGFAARFGRDVSAYTGRVVPVDDELFGPAFTVDAERERAGRCLDDAIADHHREPDATYRSLRRLLDGIRDDHAVRRVEQLMERSPWSTRTTQRVFQRYVGVTPKWVLCRYRLQRAALDIETRSAIDLADLAVRHGWYDQAHFSHDFRTMLGCAPGEYANTYRA